MKQIDLNFQMFYLWLVLKETWLFKNISKQCSIGRRQVLIFLSEQPRWCNLASTHSLIHLLVQFTDKQKAREAVKKHKNRCRRRTIPETLKGDSDHSPPSFRTYTKTLPPSATVRSLSVRSLTQNKVLPSPVAPWRPSDWLAPPTATSAPLLATSRGVGSKAGSGPSASASILTLSERNAE